MGTVDRPGANGRPEASFEALTPTAYLDRSAAVFPDRTAVVDGDLRLTYAGFHDRCLRQAGLPAGLGVEPGSGKIRKFELRAAAWAGRDRVGAVGDRTERTIGDV